MIDLSPTEEFKRDLVRYVENREYTTESKYDEREDVSVNGNLVYIVSSGGEGCSLDDRMLCIDILIRIGARCDEVNPDEGVPIIIHAARQQHIEILDAIVKNGAVVDAADPLGQNALVISILNGKKDFVKYLMELGVFSLDIKVYNEDFGMLEIDWFITQNWNDHREASMDILKCLISRGLNFDPETYQYSLTQKELEEALSYYINVLGKSKGAVIEEVEAEVRLDASSKKSKLEACTDGITSSGFIATTAIMGNAKHYSGKSDWSILSDIVEAAAGACVSSIIDNEDNEDRELSGEGIN